MILHREEITPALENGSIKERSTSQLDMIYEVKLKETMER